MQVEQMTNEELCRYYWFQGDDDTDGHLHYDVGKEIERRLRNSIPKPVVEVVNDDDGTSRVEVNGTMIIICPTALANTRAYYLRDALGMEGGGDE